MGNSHPVDSQYKICMECKNMGKINENIRKLNSNNDESAIYVKHLLMCSHGHIFAYKTYSNENSYALHAYFIDTERIKALEYKQALENDNTRLNSENDKLKSEIVILRQKLKMSSNNCDFIPSAPPLYEMSSQSEVLSPTIAQAVLVENIK